MEFHYRVRAFVDASMEEVFVIASSAHEAMLEFSETSAVHMNGIVFGDYAIEVAMLHKVTFTEDGPVFEDVTHQLTKKWVRSSFGQCMRFYQQEEIPA